MDPHSFGCLGSGSVLGTRIRIRIQEHGNWAKFTNKADSYLRMFFDRLRPFEYGILHVKIQLFVTQKSYQDPDPDLPGSAFGWASWIRIRIRIRIRTDIKSWIRVRIETNADPQHCQNL
jgi:hypothetical protein